MPGFKQIKDKNHDTFFFGRHRGFSFTFFIYANNEPKSALAHDLGDCCDNKGKLAKRVFTCLPGLVLFICFQRKQLFLYSLCDLALFFIDRVLIHTSADAGQRVDIAVSADHSAGIQDGSASNFHAIAEHGAEFLDPGLDIAVLRMDFDQQFIGVYV